MTKGAAAAPLKKPKLGQHFLRDEHAVIQIVEALGDISKHTVVEIGPGPGILTVPLARKARQLIAIEMDRVLAAQLSLKFALATNVEVIEADVLSIDFDTLFAPRPGMLRPGIARALERVHVVGNLPYYITSDILLHLFRFQQYFHRVVIMVQSEVADRLAAKPGGREYGLLSATTQLHARVEKLFSLPPSAFQPPPKVNSAVVRLTMEPKAERLGIRVPEFMEFLKLVFAQKRKTLWNNLKISYPERKITAALDKTGTRPGVRAEALPLETMSAIFRGLNES